MAMNASIACWMIMRVRFSLCRNLEVARCRAASICSRDQAFHQRIKEKTITIAEIITASEISSGTPDDCICMRIQLKKTGMPRAAGMRLRAMMPPAFLLTISDISPCVGHEQRAPRQRRVKVKPPTGLIRAQDMKTQNVSILSMTPSRVMIEIRVAPKVKSSAGRALPMRTCKSKSATLSRVTPMASLGAMVIRRATSKSPNDCSARVLASSSPKK